jgi:inner membrane transporter RhtA
MLLGVRSSGPVDPIGVAFALASAAGWAGYILCGRVASRSFGGSTGPVALTLAAMLVLPIGIFEAGPALLSPAVLPVALLMAVFAAAIPFSLEFYSLPRLPARTFAIMTSLEPVFGVLAGWVILHETLSPTRLAGVAVVVVAAAGAAWSRGKEKTQPEPPLVTP